MRSRRRVFLGAAGVLLAVTSLASPATAAPTSKLALVQGVPGIAVDVCIDGKEVKSGLRYSKSVKRSVVAKSHKIKFFKKDPRRCKGVLLGQKTVAPQAGQQWTVVVSRGSKKVVVFPLIGSLSVSGEFSAFTWNHAAKAGPVYLHRVLSLPVQPGAFLALTKGDRVEMSVAPALERRIASWMVRVSDARTLAGPREQLVPSGRLIELILVGTKPRNYRFATVNSRLPSG
jgi:hypothetical protein